MSTCGDWVNYLHLLLPNIVNKTSFRKNLIFSLNVVLVGPNLITNDLICDSAKKKKQSQWAIMFKKSG